jgi:hypothetical protein
MDADEDRYTAAIALAPFLAEHYYATGRDLVDVAALDQAIMGLAAAYAQLPALAQQTSEAAARPGISATVAARGRLLCRQAKRTAERDRYRDPGPPRRPRRPRP